MLGPLFIDIEGFELTAEDREILQHPLVGGVIYFSRNFESREQIRELTRTIKALRQSALLIAVDHEGGRVQRFRNGFTVLPAVNTIGLAYDEHPEDALNHAFHHGWLMAAELRAVGIDFSFAPVLDLDYGRSQVIGDRAFHQDPEKVARIAGDYIKGMNAAGMAATGKHFPGHGWAREDSHIAIPQDERELESILQHDVIPYTRLYNDMLTAIMPAHVIYSQVDIQPACFSAQWLQEILRKKIGFEGLIISDDLSMEGASIVAEAIPDRALAAIEAGCDMVLICNQREAVVATLDSLKYGISSESQQRIELLRGLDVYDHESDEYKRSWQHACRLVAELTELTV
mgnify:CR=1 FL=1